MERGAAALQGSGAALSKASASHPALSSHSRGCAPTPGSTISLLPCETSALPGTRVAMAVSTGPVLVGATAPPCFSLKSPLVEEQVMVFSPDILNQRLDLTGGVEASGAHLCSRYMALRSIWKEMRSKSISSK